jgi:hypothetical protein
VEIVTECKFCGRSNILVERQQHTMSKWGKFLDILQQVAPIALATIPATRPIAGLIVHAMTTAGQMPDKTGAERKVLALQIVADSVDVTNSKAGRTVLDKGATLTAAETGIETAYRVTQLVHDAHAQAATLPIPTGSLD